MQNDIFYVFHLNPPAWTNSLKTTVIHPATEKIINKFTQKPSYLVEETPEIYNTVTRPYIMDHLSDMQWVDNLLSGKSEADRVILRKHDPKQGYVLTADLKWDMSSTENLYCLAIVEDREIYSIRDLNQSRLPMLNELRDSCLAVIKEKFKVPKSLIRVYFHYQPAYYRLHVHFAHMRYAVGAPVIGKSVSLLDVVQNIGLDNDYYKKATMCYYIKDGHALSETLDKHGLIERE